MDATLIAAPPSTKNKAKTRDPEMRQTRKGKQWHFGMKLHAGTDMNGTVHTVSATDAAQSDIGQLGRLRLCSKRRAKGEHAFGVVKHLWGFTKVRYRGLVKNLGRAHVAFGLSNLYRLRGALGAAPA